MRSLGILSSAIFLAVIGGVAIHQRSVENEHQSKLALAKKVAGTCGISAARVRLIPANRKVEVEVGITGFFFDPATKEKDAQLSCFEDRMKQNHAAFVDQTFHGYFEEPVMIE